MNDVLAVLNAQTEQPTPSQAYAPRDWMQPGDADIWPDIRERILTHIRDQPRSRQREIGPSELGTTCVRCLAKKLILRPTETVEDNAETKWMPFIGTSVHAMLEHMFEHEEWCQPEQRVTVGTLTGSRLITGSIDLWDERNKATIDWKIVGNSTLEHAMRHGPSQQYRIQASLYGIGKTNEGTPVHKSCIYYLPRNASSLYAAVPYEADFDPAPGYWALARARQLLALYEQITMQWGVGMAESWRCRLPCDERECFHCREAAQTPTGTDFASLAGTRHHEDPDPLPKPLQDLLGTIPGRYQPWATTEGDTNNNSKPAENGIESSVKDS